MGRTAISGDGDEGFSRSEMAEVAEFDIRRHPTSVGRIVLGYQDVQLDYVPEYKSLRSVPMSSVVEYRPAVN